MAKKTLTLHLAKPDVTDFVQILSETARERLTSPLTQVINAPNFSDGAKLFVFVGIEAVPNWLRDLRTTFSVPGQVLNSSACAILAFKAHGRMFVSTFAHGWTCLEDDNIEGDFGLRVALNSLDEKKLKRLERANLGDALRGVSQSPFQREFTSFGLDDSLDLIRRLSGLTRQEASADSVSGSRSLKVSGDFEIESLPNIAGEALAFYSSVDYRNSSFKIIDFVSPIADSRLASLLDDLAAQSIRDSQGQFELGLPVSYTDDSLTYKFSGPGLRGSYPDLLMRHYTEALGDRIADCDSTMLKEHKVIAVYSDDTPSQKWSVRSSLIGSMTYNDGRYAINEGEWYRIDDSFKASIEEGFISLKEEWGVQPIPLRKIYDATGARYQTEPSYNQEWATRDGFLLLDTHEIQIPSVRRSQFEPCDLLDVENKRFIHVKKSSRRSSVLSHFFKQGSNSGQQFARFPAAWSQLLVLVGQLHGPEAEHKLKIVIDDDRKWKVEFVIADTPRQNGSFNIPFFSKISLRDESISLKAMGYEVGVKFIGLEPDPL